MMSPAFEVMTSWPSLWAAAQRALHGRRSRASSARFEFALADEVLRLQDELRAGSWRPGRYVHFEIHEPKRRLISAAPLRDRVVHHALCAATEPRFERVFIEGSFANRVGKGVHRALARCAELARRDRHALRMDVRQHFPSIDHAVLRAALTRHIPEPDLMDLVDQVLASADEAAVRGSTDLGIFPGDDLLALCRPRGLPIDNLTSQLWSNVLMHGLDLCVTRELGYTSYLRYVDDLVLFADEPEALWRAKARIVQRLAELRLRPHEGSAQVQPCNAGIPWLGFVVYPQGPRVKARKVRQSTRHLRVRHDALMAGQISFAEFDSTIQGWLAHVRWGDASGGLRRHVLEPLVWPVGARLRPRP